PERYCTPISISSGASARRQAASSRTLARRAEVAPTLADVSTSVANRVMSEDLSCPASARYDVSRTYRGQNMAAKQAYVPSMADAAVKAKTGKDWAGWFGLLDRAGAKKLEHKQIAQVLRKDHGVPSWWSQMVTVEYERSRGMRERHETT